MKRVERRAKVAAPPPEVFAFLADLDNIGEWQAGVVSIERTSPGPMGAGTTVRLVRDLMGQRVEAPLTVTDYEEASVLGIESTVSGVNARAMLDLTPMDGGDATELHFSVEIRGRSIMTGFLEGVVAKAAATDIDASLARIRDRFGGADETADQPA